MVKTVQGFITRYTEGHTARRVLVDLVGLGLAIFVGWSLWVGISAQTHKSNVNTAVSKYNSDAICQQTQILIRLSLENAKTDAQIDRITKVARIYVAPVNKARHSLGLPPCVVLPKESK